ncbi:Rad52/Rad22 family DNA repair protein [Aliikangiella coralliicola]|uniref:DNA repair protein Rad52 n=1 Tax=Aliikangiella coralliicola TaxID=2592383 RepID=A0A545U064_9GAMM|nr:Rad52/Rad22 family DNA repair protein [Aliikangiella coralliicola]TQV82823.1 DNA repair protein Rad52 [Aliikangiella coralliicola]
MDIILNQFKEPFKPNEIHWRIGRKSRAKDKATALAYLDARNVMKRLDDVIGFANWQDKYIETASGRLICELSIRIGDEWITKSDGAGDTNVEGEKGAISDAFKRAAVKFGIGRYLYYLDGNRYYPIDQWGKFTTPPILPDWALPKQKQVA